MNLLMITLFDDKGLVIFVWPQRDVVVANAVEISNHVTGVGVTDAKASEWEEKDLAFAAVLDSESNR